MLLARGSAFLQDPTESGRRTDIPVLTLADHNVSYIQLSGEDAQLDALHSVPEPVVLRIFLAAQTQPDGRVKVTRSRCSCPEGSGV